MKRSSDDVGTRSIRAGQALLVGVDLVARLAAPLSLVALLRQWPQAALISAAAMAGLAALRAVLAGHVMERALQLWWGALVRATRRHDVAALRTRPDIHGSAALMEAVANVAHADTSYGPRVVSDSVGFAAILLVLSALLSWGWLLAGMMALALASGLVVFAQLRMKQANAETFDAFADAAHDFDVLLGAATELRVHGREASHAEQLLARVADMAAAQRRAVGYSALMGLFPMGVALLILIAPFGLGGASLSESLGGRIAEAGVLGGAALVFGLGVARAVEGLVRCVPYRRALASYVLVAADAEWGGDRDVGLRDTTIELRDLAVRYPGAKRETPGGLSFTWEPSVPGVAVTGANGAGKSTMALCLLGLMRPTRGNILIDGTDASVVDWARVRPGLVYVPQDGFIADDRSVAWHLRQFSAEVYSDEQLIAALREVRLWEILDQRRQHTGMITGLDTPASQLSGGERKRMQLARTLLGHPELVVLDEPEAGLDAASRGWLRELLTTLAARGRVLLIAHDLSIVPEPFMRLPCLANELKGLVSPGVEPASRLERRPVPESLAQASIPRDTDTSIAASAPMRKQPGGALP